MQKLGLLSLLAFGTFVSAKNVSSIFDCPALTSREPATNVTDLRVDDIKVVGFLGDR